MKSKPYWSWRPWIRWFIPLPILVWYSKRVFGNNHVWYQDEKVNLELRSRFEEEDGNETTYGFLSTCEQPRKLKNSLDKETDKV